MKNSLSQTVSTYFASLIVVGSIIPIIASFIALLLYFTLPNFPVNLVLRVSPESSWYTLAYSSFLAIILWLIIAIPFTQFCRAKYAQPRNFTQIHSRLSQLEAYLEIPDNCKEDGFKKRAQELEYDKDTRHIIDILKEAFNAYKEARENIDDHNGLTWITCTGYNRVWTLIHHAEEALIEVAKDHIAVRGAKHDYEAIHHSKLQQSKRQRLLKDVEDAVKVLQPEASIYFNNLQSNPHNPTFSTFHASNSPPSTSIRINPSLSISHATNSPSSEQVAVAKGILREVRSALNDYRDKIWEALARQKVRLLVAITITGIVTYGLLCVILVANKPPNGETSITRTCFIAATIFYLIGTITGLFSRLYLETRRKASGDDLGLGKARLIASILLSGLAGLMGVIFTEALGQFGGIASLIGSTKPQFIPPIALPNVFSLNPILWFMAAIFGLTPNLIIQVLQRKTDQYLTELQSTSTAKGTIFKNPGSQSDDNEELTKE